MASVNGRTDWIVEGFQQCLAAEIARTKSARVAQRAAFRPKRASRQSAKGYAMNALPAAA
jgi:hypothetical protein